MTTALIKEIDADTWQNWQFSIPNSIESFEGHTRGDAATVVVRGRGRRQRSLQIHVLQLLRHQGKWKVAGRRLDVN